MQLDLLPLAAVYTAFAVKHLLCDYVLQPGWMAAGKNAAAGWQKPLLAHAATHGAATLVICLLAAPALWWLALCDLLVHAAIDRAKALLTQGFRADEQRYWTAFGLDQLAHQMTHFALVLAILAGR